MEGLLFGVGWAINSEATAVVFVCPTCRSYLILTPRRTTENEPCAHPRSIKVLVRPEVGGPGRVDRCATTPTGFEAAPKSVNADYHLLGNSPGLAGTDLLLESILAFAETSPVLVEASQNLVEALPKLAETARHSATPSHHLSKFFAAVPGRSSQSRPCS